MKLTIGTSEGKVFSWPGGLEAITQTFAILAKKGMGKSYTASVNGEEFMNAGQQIVVLDPTGAWWGLQSSADGKSPGFPIVVFGGDHANVPLERTAGEVIAQAIVEKKFSAVIDLSLLRKGEANSFVGIFLETLYRINRHPLHLIVDEADAFAPQTPYGEMARTLGAMEDIVRRGRIRGIGTTLITQRPQIINKNVLTQCEVLIALGMSHPKDIRAIEEWVDVHGDPALAKTMIASLPSLPKGTAWIWAPGWGDIFQKVKIRSRETFDSGATPKPGEKIRRPKQLAKIDIEALGKTIEETVERKKADDPKALRAQIAELQKKLQAPVAIPKNGQAKTKKVEVPVLKDGQLKRVESFAKNFQTLLSSGQKMLSELTTSMQKVNSPAPAAPIVVQQRPQIAAPINKTVQAPRKTAQTSNNTDHVTPAKQRILNAIAWLESIRVAPGNRNVVAWLADTTATSSGFVNNVGALRTSGLVDYPQQGYIGLTEEGRAIASYPDTPLTTAELQSMIFSKLPPAKQAILKALIAQYPGSMSRKNLAEAAGTSATSSGFVNNVGSLRTMGLLDYPQQGFVAATSILFV